MKFYGLSGGSAEVGASQPSSAALNTMGFYRVINAKQQKAAQERKIRVPVRYPPCSRVLMA
jgi:hypothetical protein